MHLASIGLILDIFGVILMWIFPIPPFPFLKDGAELLYAKSGPESLKKSKRNNFWHRTGLILLLLGFILQFVSIQVTNKRNSNQRFEPIVKTPLDKVDGEGTQAHP